MQFFTSDLFFLANSAARLTKSHNSLLHICKEKQHLSSFVGVENGCGTCACTCRQKQGRRWLEEEASWAAPSVLLSQGLLGHQWKQIYCFKVVQIGSLRSVTESRQHVRQNLDKAITRLFQLTSAFQSILRKLNTFNSVDNFWHGIRQTPYFRLGVFQLLVIHYNKECPY